MAASRSGRSQPARRASLPRSRTSGARTAGGKASSGKPAARKSAARKPASRKPATRKPAARKRSTPVDTKRTRRARRGPSPTARRLRAAAGGDRPYMAALVVLLVVVVTMALGPLQNYTAAADRVDELESTRDQLAAQVDRLEDRRAQLQDPDELELIARGQLGMVKPGEIPFVVVTPDTGGQEQVRPEPVEAEPAGDGPWFRRLGRSLANLFDTDA